MSVPTWLWLMPMLQSVIAARARPKGRAAATMISAENPVSAAARAGGYRSITLRSRQPAARVLGHEILVEKSFLPEHVEHGVEERDVRAGPERQWRSAMSAVSVQRGSATMTATSSGAASLRLRMRFQVTGWQSAVFVPIRKKQSAVSMSS